MGFFDDFFDGDGILGGSSQNSRQVPGTNGKYRFLVSYINTNGTPCAQEFIAYSSGQAMDAVRGRSDVKSITSVRQI